MEPRHGTHGTQPCPPPEALQPFSEEVRQGRNLFRGYVPAKVLEAAERYVVEEPEEVEEEVEEDYGPSPT